MDRPSNFPTSAPGRLLALVAAARLLMNVSISQTPVRRSPRAIERGKVRSAAGRGGVARQRLLDDLNVLQHSVLDRHG